MSIGIDEIICTSEYYINDSEDLCYDAESISRPTKCINPECKCDIKPHYHSKSRNLLKDIKRNGKLTYINLTIKRYRCPECHRVFYEQFDFYDRKNFLTKRLREEIIKKSIAGESCYKISKEYRIDKKTIIRTIKDYFYSHVESNYETTKTGILLQTIKNKECITLLDLEKNKVIDVNESFGIHTISALTQ